MKTDPDDLLVPADDNLVVENQPVVTAANADDFDDEDELVLPTAKANLNRMGMDTIGCIGCQ